MYWACGGQWAIDVVIPTKNNHEPIKPPAFLITCLVGLTFYSFTIIALQHTVFWPFLIPAIFKTYGLYGIALLFITRAVGDFKDLNILIEKNDAKFIKRTKGQIKLMY